jgi:uncharacterized protein YbcI
MSSDDEASANAAERRLAAVPTGSSIQLEIANAVVRANKELFGRGPTKARVILQSDVVICVMGNCLTTAERTLVQNGRREAVALLRHEMHTVACPTLARIVERVTGRRVVACTAGMDLDADEQVSTFRLDGEASPDEDDSGPVRER